MNRVLLCLLDNDDSLGLTIPEIRDRLSDYMSRADLESAVRRLRGGHPQIERVEGQRPARWQITKRGRDIATRLVANGERY